MLGRWHKIWICDLQVTWAEPCVLLFSWNVKWELVKGNLKVAHTSRSHGKACGNGSSQQQVLAKRQQVLSEPLGWGICVGCTRAGPVLIRPVDEVVDLLVCRETEKPRWTILYFLFFQILRMQKKFCKDEIFGGNDPSSRQDSAAFKMICCGGVPANGRAVQW